MPLFNFRRRNSVGQVVEANPGVRTYELPAAAPRQATKEAPQFDWGGLHNANWSLKNRSLGVISARNWRREQFGGELESDEHVHKKHDTIASFIDSARAHSAKGDHSAAFNSLSEASKMVGDQAGIERADADARGHHSKLANAASDYAKMHWGNKD